MESAFEILPVVFRPTFLRAERPRDIRNDLALPRVRTLDGCPLFAEFTFINSSLFSFFADFEYDAFILYSSKDREFAENTLLPLLEDRFQLICCVHYRDFTPGAPYVQNIVNSVLKSRKIVVVMSQNFLESNFCDYELQVAMQRLLEWRDDSVLVIKVGSLGRRQMPVLLQQRSYIDYTQLVERVNWTDRVRAFMMRSDGPLSFAMSPRFDCAG